MRHHMDVVYVTDENYAMPTGISIFSLLKNKTIGAEIAIYIIAKNVSQYHKEQWNEIVSNQADLKIIDMEDYLYDNISDYNLICISHVNATSLLKFIIPNLLSSLDKVLYIDGDTIVNADISCIGKVDISNQYVAAVIDMGDEKTQNGSSVLGERIGLDDNEYFNSGIMLLNLDKMRKDEISDKLFDYRINGKNYFMDQDAFNIVLQKHKVLLPYSFNFRTPLFEVMDFQEINEKFFLNEYQTAEECIRDQYILHLTDRRKPWDYWVPWFTAIFLKYYEASPYCERKLNIKSPLPLLSKTIRILEMENNSLSTKLQNMDWRFPMEKIPRGSKIILYGSGKIGKNFQHRISISKYCSIVLWVDKNYMQNDGACSPEEIAEVEYDYILIAIADKEARGEVMTFLNSMGVAKNKIVTL